MMNEQLNNDSKPMPEQMTYANLLFIGVPVPTGVHTVELSYFPPGLVPGAALALLALLAAAWMLRMPEAVEAAGGSL